MACLVYGPLIMDLIIVSLVALLASGLTLFSGFGLGSLLMPVVALFFPLEVAIGITAIVHLANNLFKVTLLGKHTEWSVFLRFGGPALVAAVFGAWMLGWLAENETLITYSWLGHDMITTPLRLIVGGLILLFVLLEFSRWFAALALDRKFLPVGGIISGFFGGLSGHQARLTKEQFVATGVMVAVVVDVTRLLVYGKDMAANASQIVWPLVISATLCAFFGAWLGRKLLKKVTIKVVHLLVSGLLTVVSLGLMTGVI
jgi:uncharacterized membrane protein YfcA